MNLDDVLAKVAREALGPAPSDDEAFALVIVLHTHRLRFAVLPEDLPGREVEALTQRGAAAVVAAAWPDRADCERTDYVHWYWRFNMNTPFEVLEDVSGEWPERVACLRDRVVECTLVENVEPAD